jgi:hypothetical protein
VAHVFISYAREDREFARRLAEALQQNGFTVWWDWDLVGGSNFRSRIKDAIGEASKAVVLWSERSVASGFVIDEASEAKRLGKLVPLRIDNCATPFGFGDIHTIDFRDIGRDLDTLVAALNDLPPPRKPTTVSRRGTSIGIVAAGIVAATAGLGGLAYRYLPRPPTHLGNRIALVIGNSAYRNLPHIDNGVRDAERVSAALEKRGFRVISALDVDNSEMARLFTDFENTLAVVGGIGLFYYAGQAAYIDGEDILFPVDASLDEQRAAAIGGLNLTRLMKEVQSRTTSSLQDNGTAIIYSASKGQLASDGPPGGDSPFTTAFLESFSDEDELSDTFRKIRVAMKTPPAPANAFEAAIRPHEIKQDPYLESSLRFKFYFNHPDRDPAEGAAKILIFDSCRDNPFKLDVAAKR